MRAALCFVVLLLVAPPVGAHGFAPSLLEIEQRDETHATVRFFGARALAGAQPSVQGCAVVATLPVLLVRCETRVLTLVLPSGDGDVVVQHRAPSGEVAATTQPLGATVRLALGQPAALGFGPAIALGAHHIASGVDHLLFVAALVTLVGFRRRLLWLITGFTLGHSVTLVLASRGVVRVPPLYVEALIALSLVLVARELLRPVEESLLARRPLPLAALFGLVHGLGFATALDELGVADAGRAVVLIGFNVGVELGQLLFVGVLLGGALLLLRWRRVVRPTVAYAVGLVGIALLCDRVAQW